MKTFKLGELFAGAGGLAWGAVHAECDCGWKIIHVWANDCDPSTCATYIKIICPNAPDTVICCDVRNLNLDALGDIDTLAFGFPCNDFFVVGKRRGLLSANGGEAKSKILEGFRDAGYKIFPHLYKFEEYGVPQTRHRIIVVGIRNGIEKSFRPPSPASYSGKNVSLQNAFNADIPSEFQLHVKSAL